MGEPWQVAWESWKQCFTVRQLCGDTWSCLCCLLTGLCLSALLTRTFTDHVMLFTQTKKQAHRMHILLGLMGLQVGELHGNLSQTQRLEALRYWHSSPGGGEEWLLQELWREPTACITACILCGQAL